MRNCPFCGAPISEASRFCPQCGVAVAELTPPAAPKPPVFASSADEAAPVSLIPTQSVPERDAAGPDPADSLALKELRMHLHQESKAWRFYAIGVLVIMMGLAGFLLFLGGTGALLFSDGSLEDTVGGAFVLSIFVIYGLVLTLMLLPVVIIGFVMGSKVHRYWEESAADCGNALKHSGSVGVIVLAGFFSTPALIFVIINFVKTKRNRAELEAVLARQKANLPRASHE